jgi:hypothetical protein
MQPSQLRAFTDEYGRGVPGRSVDFVRGSHWAYRYHADDELVEVEVVRQGVKKPARVLVRWVDDEFEGRQDWVPPARLKVPWESVEELRAWETRWAEIQSAANGIHELVQEATDYVIETLIDREIAEMGWGGQEGVIKIHDVNRLAAFLDLSPETLRDDPLAFDEESTLVASMPTAVRVAQRAAGRDPRKLLAEIERDEARGRHDAVYGSSYGRRHIDYVSPEVCAQIDEERVPLRTLMREWCGAEPVSLRAEITALREEARRLHAIARKAVDGLRAVSRSRAAKELEAELSEIKTRSALLE